MPENAEKEVKWLDSSARKILLDALKDGSVPLESTKDSKPRHVLELFKDKPEFQVPGTDYADKKLFGSRLRSLRRIVMEQRKRVKEDASVFANTRKKHPKATLDVRGKPQWKGSAMEAHLKEDIDEGKHKEMKPKELHESKAEYKVYDLEVFRKRIHQELYDHKKPVGTRPSEKSEIDTRGLVVEVDMSGN